MTTQLLIQIVILFGAVLIAWIAGYMVAKSHAAEQALDQEKVLRSELSRMRRRAANFEETNARLALTADRERNRRRQVRAHARQAQP